ncbi:MAG: Two-component system histidine kinase DccS [uncultured Sulfurovum sp.]|uniref:histidine kinase n=1 Tax=uncultured Sulfurovum sp. TaxID=269237 RepID=A0A6S6SI60_9BACT|nr:MAG: Two-component system histidine kinase DccS [uncultured Sulfurovum sp.]
MCEESDIKLFERESLLKAFTLFFVVIELFLAFIFYNYYRLEEEHLSEELFLEMKNHSFFFDDARFEMDIVNKTKEQQLYELYFNAEYLYILVPFPKDNNNVLQIMYPNASHQIRLKQIQQTLFWQFFLLSSMAIFISFIFGLYALSPLRTALELLEEFIKDIIHDLNTPISSILINLKMMDKNEEVESISQSVKTISMLHKNLDVYLKDSSFDKEHFFIKELIEEQVNFFAPLYDYLKWEVNVPNTLIYSNQNALNRILYNLLNNACKYNTSNGFIKINMQNNRLSISNSSYGIQNPSKVFNRFYKEGERGLGIGLHIVEKLCNALEIKKTLEVTNNIFSIHLTLEVTLK